MFAGEILIGTVLNVYVTIKWIKDRRGRGKSKDGNNFIATLKIIDLVICVTVIPFSLAALVVARRDNTVVCFLKEGLVVFAGSGSCAGVLLISFDRYCAVVLPTKKVLTPKRVRLCRLCVVFVSILGLILPSFCLFMGHFYTGVKLSKEALHCREVIWVFQENYFYNVYYILLFVVTVFCVFLCYRSVLQVVRRRLAMHTTTLTMTSSVTSESDAKAYRFRRQEFRATRLAFAIVLTFLVCWGPHVIVIMIQMKFPTSVVLDMIQSVCLVIAYLTTIVHPVIYSHETMERSTPVIARSTSLPLLKSLFTRRSLRVTPDQTRNSPADQSCSFAHVTVPPLYPQTPASHRLSVSEFTV